MKDRIIEILRVFSTLDKDYGLIISERNSERFAEDLVKEVVTSSTEEKQYLEKILRLDCENQHLKYYQEGYREYMLTAIHGDGEVWKELQIDTERYAPGGARRISYEEGWEKATNDYNIFNTTHYCNSKKN